MSQEVKRAPTELLDAVDPSSILRVSRILREGGVVALPTDTLYGIGASVFRPDAIRRVFEMKHRPAGLPMPVLILGVRDVGLLVPEIPFIAWPLIERFWPWAVDARAPRTTVSLSARARRRHHHWRARSGSEELPGSPGSPG